MSEDIFETVNLDQPIYLSNVIKIHIPVRALRSSTETERSIIPAAKTVISAPGCRVAASTVWNTIPFEIGALPVLSMATFRRIKLLINCHPMHPSIRFACKLLTILRVINLIL